MNINYKVLNITIFSTLNFFYFRSKYNPHDTFPSLITVGLIKRSAMIGRLLNNEFEVPE